MAERLSQEELKRIEGLYIKDGDRVLPILPEVILTPENFGVFADGNLLTAKDFRWYEEDGSDRCFVSDSFYDWIEPENTPNEVVSFLNEIIGVEFAKKELNNAKVQLDEIDDEAAKSIISNAIEDFEKATTPYEKLTIASDALFDLSDTLNLDKALRETFTDVYDVITEVMEDID